MSDHSKTSYRLEIALKYDAIPISSINRLVRETVGSESLFTNLGKDQESGETWLWKGDGSEAKPFHWIKISPSRAHLFSGFHSGWKNWLEFRQKGATALTNFLPEITHDCLAYINNTYLWQVAPEDIKAPEKASSDLLPISRKFLSADLKTIEHDESRRASLDMYLDRASKEIQFLAVLQHLKFDPKKTILQTIDLTFEQTDPDFQKANSQLLEIIG
jgi:hypothetical protein